MQAQNWVQQNGNPYSRSAVDDARQHLRVLRHQVHGVRAVGRLVHAAASIAACLPDRGQRQSLSLSSSIPGSAVEYWVARLPVPAVHADLAAASPGPEPARRLWRVPSAAPPACRRTGSSLRGGPDTVRGFRESRLGPKDNLRQPLWRQPAGGGAGGGHHPDAPEVAVQRPGQPVLRHWQRVLDQ